MTISILTATYNSDKTLRDTIESVLRQGYRDFEYIIIDGGSKDRTLDVIKEYEPTFEGRLKYISEPDHGIYDAMNKGIRMATGDVVGILNSDDFYTSDDALQKIADAFEENDIDATYGDIHFVNDDDLSKMVRYYSRADVFVNPSQAETFGLTTAEALTCGTPAIVYNTTACPEIVDEGTGAVVAFGDTLAMADKVKDMCYVSALEQEERRRLCRQRAVALFNKNDRYQEYLDLYNSLLKQ